MDRQDVIARAPTRWALDPRYEDSTTLRALVRRQRRQEQERAVREAELAALRAMWDRDAD